MSWLKRLPIRRKLIAFTLATGGIALILALVACFSVEIYASRARLARDLTAVAEVVAGNAAGPLAFKDADSAKSMLSALSVRAEVTGARLTDTAGVEFARFDANGLKAGFPELQPGQQTIVEGFHIYVFQPVTHSGETLGVLEVTANVRGELVQLAITAAGACLLVLAGAMLLAYLLAVRFQATITHPLMALAEAAREVTAKKDYSLRAAKEGDDEIGDLTDAFNAMLAEVQHRDSALREASEKLAEQFKALESESAERLKAQEETRALERKLEQTQRLESLGVLAGGIAHDFNNILTGILGSASLARLNADPGSDLDRHLERMEVSSRRAAELCEQMLAYAGKGRVIARPVDINILVRETLDMLHAKVPSDAQVEVNFAAELPAVVGDPARLRQVAMNLVMNALEALASGERKVTVWTRLVSLDASQVTKMAHPMEARPGDYVAIIVTDTGVGIAPDQLRRIFEPFYTSKFTGRGLGLSAVLGIIRGSGGGLDIDSEPGRGTTFRVYFPASDAVAHSVHSNGTGAALHAFSHGGTVLVVDDEKIVREVAAAALNHMGFRVLSTSNGAEAVERLKCHVGPVAGVFLDLTMPGMDGAATLQALRALRPGLKAVLMSGYDEEGTLAHFDDLRVSGFLQKPFSVQNLCERAMAFKIELS